MNKSTPVCLLPIELLSSIFVLVVRDEIRDYYRAAKEDQTFFVNAPLRLSWVCQYFRAVVQNTPQCWTFTQMDAAKSIQERLLYYSLRWKQMPGTVVAENATFNGGSQRYTLMSLFPTGMVAEYVYRERAGERASWSPVELPMATKVIIHLRDIGEDSVRHGNWTQSFRYSSAPILVAEIYNCVLMDLPKTLEELKWSVRTSLRFHQLAAVITLPNLRRLHLCHLTFATRALMPRQNPLVNLTHLVLENMSCQLLRYLSPHLLPALRHLGLFDFAFAEDRLEMFIRGISSHLSFLDIVGPPALQLSEWRPLLSAATNVVELTIGIRGPVNVISNRNFLEALADPTAGLPSLSTLVIHSQLPYLPPAAFSDRKSVV